MAVFVDTSVWFSALVSEDASSRRCSNLLASHPGRLVTTDYVIDELITLLTARGYHEIALRAGASLLEGPGVRIHWIQKNDIYAAWGIFQRCSDKRWSFTDCTSYAVMQRLGVTEALALDDHFRQFGFVSVKP